jgi:type I restriction enzyme M protein
MEDRTHRILPDTLIAKIAGTYHAWRGYVGAAAVEADSEPFAEKMARLTATLEQQFAESARLEKVIRESLRRVGYPAESE